MRGLCHSVGVEHRTFEYRLELPQHLWMQRGRTRTEKSQARVSQCGSVLLTSQEGLVHGGNRSRPRGPVFLKPTRQSKGVEARGANDLSPRGKARQQSAKEPVH